MSDLSKPAECIEWIRDWRKGANPVSAERAFRRALEEQSNNLANIKFSIAFGAKYGNAMIWSSIVISEYERSVAMLKRAVESGHYQ